MLRASGSGRIVAGQRWFVGLESTEPMFVELNDLKLTPVVHLYVVCAVPSTRTGYAR